jgi:hypothetical protein
LLTKTRGRKSHATVPLKEQWHQIIIALKVRRNWSIPELMFQELEGSSPDKFSTDKQEPIVSGTIV